jgi:ferrochelatase
MNGKLGVVLFQLGGPDSTEAIEPFLYNLFSDPDIIDFPLAKLARRPLARLIASRRGKHVAHHYEAIGGKSPILDFTTAQAKALESELRRDFDAQVTVAMRYWKPFTGEAVSAMRAFGATRIVLLPLYPQYSRTTTGSSYKEWNRQMHDNGWRPKVDFIEQFHEDPAYIQAVAAAVDRELRRFAEPSAVDLVFSAHSVPVDVIERGDPYQRQIERTVELVAAQGGWNCRRHLCYQSKVGPSKWLRPMMREMLEGLAAGGSRNVLMVPISFVSDHVETLFEIDIEHREIAERAGITDFRMVPGLNNDSAFIAALAGLVRRAVSEGDAAQPKSVRDH